MISVTNICDITTDEISDGPIAPDSTAAETISKCFGCDIYLKVGIRTRRKMYSLAGTSSMQVFCQIVLMKTVTSISFILFYFFNVFIDFNLFIFRD